MQIKTNVQNSGKENETTQIKERLKALYAKKFRLMLNIARNGFDLPVILHFMNNPHIGNKVAGFCGTITSSISLYNLWGK